MSKKSIYKSIVQLKCPSCRTGNLFLKQGLFRFREPLKMYENCSNCGQKLEIEPGFWIGALWMSYPIVVVIETPFIIAAVSGLFDNIWILVSFMMLALGLFFPLMLRLGRSIWAHLFIRFKG